MFNFIFKPRWLRVHAVCFLYFTKSSHLDQKKSPHTLPIDPSLVQSGQKRWFIKTAGAVFTKQGQISMSAQLQNRAERRGKFMWVMY